MGGSPGAKRGEPHPLSCTGQAPRLDGSVLPAFPSWSCGDGGLVGLSAERDQSQEAAGCSVAQELQSTPSALPPCANSLAAQEGPSASSPLGHLFFFF